MFFATNTLKRIYTGFKIFLTFCSILYTTLISDSYYKLTPLISMIFVIQALSFNEILNIRDKTIICKYSRFIDYSLLILNQCIFFYIYYFKKYDHIPYLIAMVLIVLKYFLINIETDILSSQFNKFTWTIISLLVINITNFHVINLLEDIVWFLLPNILIVINDISAFAIGKCIGRTQWSIISPKKTWEGYFSAAIVTILCGHIFDNFYTIYSNTEIQHAGFHLSLMASFICPYFGLIASGIKRSIGIKDFGNIFPGHGGIIDRIDCITGIGLLTFVYYKSYS